MPEQIQNIPLGLLAGMANPSALPLAGLLPAVPAPRQQPASPPSNARNPFAGLFNTGGQASGYTPQDVQRIMGEQADYWQRFPITPQWNGGKGIGGIGPAIANFGSGYFSTAIPAQQQARAQENERIRREAAERAGGARTLEEAVAALQGGTPEQSSMALQANLQALAKAAERRQRAEEDERIWGGQAAPAPAAEQPAPTQPPASTAAPRSDPLGLTGQRSAAPTPPEAGDWSQFLGTPAPAFGANPMPATAPAYTPGTGRLPPPSLGGSPSFWMGGAPRARASQPAAAGATATPPAAQPPASPPQQPETPLPAQSEPIVQIGNRRLPLSQARAVAVRLDAAGRRSEPLEKAIEEAAKRAGPDRSAIQPQITAGLQELAGLPERYGGDSGVFGSAVGSFQGDPASNWGLNDLARAWGSFSSNFATGNNSQAPPAEVRRAVEGATNTLAQVLKPLIRGPGEGSWSDRDQAVLESIIGNLTRANDVAGYRRELNNIRSRIRSNFGVDLPAIIFPGQGQAAPRGGAAGANDPLGIR